MKPLWWPYPRVPFAEISTISSSVSSSIPSFSIYKNHVLRYYSFKDIKIALSLWSCEMRRWFFNIGWIVMAGCSAVSKKLNEFSTTTSQLTPDFTSFQTFCCLLINILRSKRDKSSQIETPLVTISSCSFCWNHNH